MAPHPVFLCPAEPAFRIGIPEDLPCGKGGAGVAATPCRAVSGVYRSIGRAVGRLGGMLRVARFGSCGKAKPRRSSKGAAGLPCVVRPDQAFRYVSMLAAMASTSVSIDSAADQALWGESSSRYGSRIRSRGLSAVPPKAGQFSTWESR